MRGSDEVTVTPNYVLIRTGNTTVSVSLDRTSPVLVAVNRDTGVPTETIAR